MTVRVTRKVRRIVERLDRSPATTVEVSVDTNISLPRTYDILDRLLDNGWVVLKEVAGDYLYSLTSHGRACLAAMPPARKPKLHRRTT